MMIGSNVANILLHPYYTDITIACEAAGRESLNIYIQVDTSGESTKSGVQMAEVCSLVTQIKENCSRLNVKGLMTIGAPGKALRISIPYLSFVTMMIRSNSYIIFVIIIR